MKARQAVELLLLSHNSHGAVLEILRHSTLDTVNKAYTTNEVFYNYFAMNTAIHNEEINSLHEFVKYFEKFEQRIENKISISPAQNDEALH